MRISDWSSDVCSSDLQNARVGESLDLIRQEWRRMAEQGPTAEELDAAKRYLTGSFPLRFSSSDNIAGMLVGMPIENLGRSAERSVGKECVSTCRSRGSPNN